MREEIRFFLPGPTHVPAEVRRALDRQPVGHRSPAFREIYSSVAERLPAVFRATTDVVVATGSATLMMEAAVASTVESEVLNLVCGAFSERWHAISRALGKSADRITVPWGEVIDPDLVRRALSRKRYEAVTVVHNETSTGVLNPLPEIARAIREESDALVLVDTVSSLAGAPVESEGWGLDVVVTGSQKALALPPGLAFFCASERALARAEGVSRRGFYTDLVRYVAKHREGSTITTPAVSLFYALVVQLGRLLEEGMEARWERHRRLRRRTAAWAEAHGFSYASAPDGASPTVSCLRPPAGVAAPDLVRRLAAEGWTVGGGYGDWKPTTFRIGHMGEVREEDLEALLATVDGLTAGAAS